MTDRPSEYSAVGCWVAALLIFLMLAFIALAPLVAHLAVRVK